MSYKQGFINASDFSRHIVGRAAKPIWRGEPNIVPGESFWFSENPVRRPDAGGDT